VGALDIENKNPLDANPDLKDQMVCDLIKQTRELVVQLKEHKEWAHGKAIQAAPKLGDDVTELRVMWMERDQNQCNKEKKVIDDDTLKRLSEMETELKTKNGTFFLEHVGELCIVVVTEEKGEQVPWNKKTPHAHVHTAHAARTHTHNTHGSG
jgi:hypothetical protein